MIYDIMVDLIKHLSISLSFLKPYATLLGVIVLLLRQNNIKKIINGKLPKRFRDTQSNDIYDMMKDIKAIKEHLGVEEWSNTQQNGQVTTPTLSYKRFFLLLQKVTILRRKKIMERLKSRKLWITIVSAVLLVIKEGFDIPVDSETVLAFAGIVITAILGLAHVDAKRAEVTKNADFKTPIEPTE